MKILWHFLNGKKKSWEETITISTETWHTKGVLHFSYVASTIFPARAIFCRLHIVLQLSIHTDKEHFFGRGSERENM